MTGSRPTIDRPEWSSIDHTTDSGSCCSTWSLRPIEPNARSKRSNRICDGGIMKKLLLVLSVMSLASFRATADDSLVNFDGGIGVDPVSGITSNAPALNVVRGIPPGGFPWVIKRLRADVQVDGQIHVDGRGLLLSGGNVLGTNGGQKVMALLFCGTPGANGTLGNATVQSTDPAGVPLDA